MTMAKKVVNFIFFVSSVASADSYDCKVSELGTNKEIAKFSLIPPDHNNKAITLPGDLIKMEVWTYNGSVGAIFTNLKTNRLELTSQMDFDSAGLFRIAFSGTSLVCETGH